MILNFSNWSERGGGQGEGLGCLFERERERESIMIYCMKDLSLGLFRCMCFCGFV